LFDAGNPIATLTLDPNGYAYGLEGESPDYYYKTAWSIRLSCEHPGL